MVSIVTSLYKSEKYLPSFLKNAKTLHHRLKKGGVIFEHILVINDASHEELSEIKNSKLDFVIISVSRETLYTSWNRGVKNSKYPYITFWSVDDNRFASGIITGVENLAKGYDATYLPYIYKRYVYLLGIKILIMIKKVNQRTYDRELFRVGMYAGPHFIFTKEAYLKNGPFDEQFKIAGDFDWWARAAKNNLKIIKTNTISGTFNNDGQTLSGSKNKLQQEENDLVVRKNNTTN